MPRFLWQGNLPNRASKIKRLLARHEFRLPRGSGQVLSYTSACNLLLLYINLICFFLIAVVFNMDSYPDGE
jgi:hypothetical protein